MASSKHLSGELPQFSKAWLLPKYWPTWLGISLIILLAHSPRRLQVWLGQGLGRLIVKLSPKRVKVCAINIAHCFPELNAEQQKQRVDQVFKTYGQSLVETAIAWSRNTQYLQKFCTIEGKHHLDTAIQRGGVLLLGGHFATIDLCGSMFTEHYRCSLVHRRADNEVLDWFSLRARQKLVNQAISRKDLRSIIRRLKAGEIVWYAPDQDFGTKGSVFSPFFGHAAATLTTTSKLVKSTEALVVPISHFRLEDGKSWKIIIHPPLPVTGKDLQADADLVNRWLETEVRRYPEQYLWMHRRFKTRPEGENPWY